MQKLNEIKCWGKKLKKNNLKKTLKGKQIVILRTKTKIDKNTKWEDTFYF
jgi:hypothetical protein